MLCAPWRKWRGRGHESQARVASLQRHQPTQHMRLVRPGTTARPGARRRGRRLPRRDLLRPALRLPVRCPHGPEGPALHPWLPEEGRRRHMSEMNYSLDNLCLMDGSVMAFQAERMPEAVERDGPDRTLSVEAMDGLFL